MQAYQIENPDGYSEIIHAETRGKAKSMAANTIGVDFIEAQIERTPEFDGYDPVPAEVFLANGWWLECAHCYHRVEDEGCYTCQDDKNTEILHVTDGTQAYCSAECRDDEKASRIRRKREQEEAKRESLARVEKAFPGVDIVGVTTQMRPVGERQWSGIVNFKYPGAQWAATWNEFEPDKLWVPNGDLEAWKVFTNCSTVTNP